MLTHKSFSLVPASVDGNLPKPSRNPGFKRKQAPIEKPLLPPFIGCLLVVAVAENGVVRRTPRAANYY